MGYSEPAARSGQTRRHARGMRSSAQEPADSGLSLVEMLVVLGILALFAAFAVPQVLKYLGTARVQAARTQLNNLVSAVELYYLDTGRYPTQEQGLRALLQKPEGVPGWQGPYLKKESGLVDPWGQPYIYRFPGEHGAFDIMSYGRDKKPGGTGEDADIVSWK